MPGRPLDCERPQGAQTTSLPAVSLQDLVRLVDEYLADCDYRQQAAATIAQRRIFLDNLAWFLRYREFVACGPRELKEFFRYLAHGHEEPGGRFGRPHLTRAVRPATVRDYWVNIKCFFNWLLEESLIPSSPMARLPKPKVPEEHTEPFTKEQVLAMLQIARRSQHPQRDEAIVLFLLDTGVRAGELCGLTMRDLDVQARSAYVLGKGNRHRRIYFSRATAAVLAQYLRRDDREQDDPVFMVDRGIRRGASLTVSGLRQIIERLASGAGITGRRRTSHAFRHTCALTMLNNGCNIYALKEFLGHRSLTTCQTYLKISEADVQAHHKQFSAVNSLRARR